MNIVDPDKRTRQWKTSTLADGGKVVKRLRVLHAVGVLLLLAVLNFIPSEDRACSWMSSLFDRPHFPFPRRHMTMKQREELFLYKFLP